MSGKGDAAVVESHQTPNIAELLNLVQDYEKEIVKLNDELENLKLERKSSNPVTDSVFLENDELKIQAKTDATLIRSLEDSILAMDEETKVLKTENARLLKITESLSTKSTGETEVDIIDSKKLFDDFQILRNEVCF